MAQQNIAVGTTPNDGTGDSLRAAMQKVNANFTEVYELSPRMDAAEASVARRHQSEFFETIDAGLYEGTVLDEDGRVLSSAAAVALAVIDPAPTVEFFETTEPFDGFKMLDQDGRILVDPSATELGSRVDDLEAEVAAARGEATTLTERLDRSLRAYGDLLGPVYGSWLLRETRMRLSRLAYGDDELLTIALIGDSYTQALTRYVKPLAVRLQDAFGAEGVGWIGFGWFGTASGTWSAGSQPTGRDWTARGSDSIGTPDATGLISILQIIGTWTVTYNSQGTNQPSLSHIASSTADDYVRFDIPDDQTEAILYYGGNGTGQIQVSWDDGGSYGSTINLSTSGATRVALTGIPATACTVRIKVVGGTVTLAGVEIRGAGTGIRVHKLGGSGSRAQQWAGVTQATWAAQIAEMAPHLVVIMHGTNDQGQSRTPAQFTANMLTIIDNVRSVLPYSDILVVMPPENNQTSNTYPMTDYADAARTMCIEEGCAFLDLQLYFGSPDNYGADYANANADRPWYNADLVHPEPETGGRAMVEAIHRLLVHSV